MKLSSWVCEGLALAQTLSAGTETGERQVSSPALSLRGYISGSSFRACILAATLAPLVVVLAMQLGPVVTLAPKLYSTGLAGALAAMGALSSSHVFSTSYLLFNPREYRGVTSPLVVLVAIPIVLVVATFAMLMAAPLWATMLFMLVYIHYGMWHFGRQNLGVLSFVARISLRRPMNSFERATIMTGVIAGMFAAYSLFAPALMLNQKAFPFDLSLINAPFNSLWYVGAAIMAALVPTSLYYAYRHRRDFDPYVLATYLASVFFYLPIFISTNPLFTLAAWTTAHGLQYIVFLGFHAAGKPKPLPSLGFLAVLIVTGYVIWKLCGAAQSGGDMDATKIAVATLSAITLVHYWVDQFLWKFNSPDRRAWLKQHYSFLVPGTT
jgi:hypothetical protein